jgi:hypothetical protein
MILAWLSQPDETALSRVRNSKRGLEPAAVFEILVVHFLVNLSPGIPVNRTLSFQPPMSSESKLRLCNKSGG